MKIVEIKKRKKKKKKDQKKKETEMWELMENKLIKSS